ncbi:MAG: hypothetical protein AAFY98_05530 [Verrucomicrobiota bacterium]
MLLRDLLSGPKLIILTLLLLFGGGAITVLALFGYIRNGCGEDLDQTGPPVAGEVIDHLTKWDDEAVLNMMPPPARTQSATAASVKSICSSIRTTLGRRKSGIEIQRGYAVGNFNWAQKAHATATYSSQCEFEYGSATIVIELIKDLKIAGANNQWYLVNIRFQEVQ